MNTRRLSATAVLLALTGAMAMGLLGPAPLHADGEAPLAALVNSMPDADRSPDGKYTGPAPEVAQKAVDIILKGGKGSIVALVDMLKDLDEGQNYKAGYLLHAVATQARRPDAEEERALVCQALVAALEGDRPTLVKKHILEELLWLGGKEPVEALTKLLLDPELYDFAARALEARRTAEPLRAALPNAKGRNRVALAQSLGVLRDAEAVPALVQAVGDADAEVRLAAVEALGNIGDARAVAPVLGAIKFENATYEDMKMAEGALRLAQCLLDAGKKDEAKGIYVALSERCTGKAGRHIRVGCLRGLAAVGTEEGMTELLSAIADPDPQVRVVAAEIAAALPGGEAVDKWLGLLAKVPPKDRTGVLFILGAIGDAKALPALLEAMDDKDAAIRLEAIRSVASIGGASDRLGRSAAAEALVARAGGKEGEEQLTALRSLVRNRGPETNAVVGAAVQKAANPALKAQLLSVLAARRAADQVEVMVAAIGDGDASVRVAAASGLEAVGDGPQAPLLVKMLKGAADGAERGAAEAALLEIGPRARDQVAATVIPELEGASPDAAAALFRVLGRVGGAKAAEALSAYAASPDPKIMDEAVRVLSNWSEANGLTEAAEALLEVAKTAKDPKHQAMALRNYISLPRSRQWRGNTAQQLTIYGEALQVAKRPEERRSILAGLQDIPEVQSLKLAASCLKDTEVAEEAAAAIVRIASRVKDKTDREVQAALAAVVEISKNARTLDEAKRFLVKEQ